MRGLGSGFFDRDGNPGVGELKLEVEGEDRTTKTDTDTWGISLSPRPMHAGSATVIRSPSAFPTTAATPISHFHRKDQTSAEAGHALRFLQSQR
ncbi:MAG: hypothetical protein ACREYC_12275 [Gammaproteobacteria bacterium]